MKPNFARAIAAALREIAECSAQKAVVEACGLAARDKFPPVDELERRINSAQHNIAAVLQQPGARLDFTNRSGNDTEEV